MQHAARYRIGVSDRIDPGWSAWLDGIDVTSATEGGTWLCGELRDQAALHGLLARIRDLGLTLVSVERIDEEGHAR